MPMTELELIDLVRSDEGAFQTMRKGLFDGLWYWDLASPEQEWISEDLLKRLPDREDTTGPERWHAALDPAEVAELKTQVDVHLVHRVSKVDQVLHLRESQDNVAAVFRCRAIVVAGPNGMPVGILCALTDITQPKEREEELERAVTSRDQFFRNMSHEMRTPMNGILGMVQLLRRQEADRKRLQMFDAIEYSAKTLLTMMDGLLDFAQMGAGQFEYDPAFNDPTKVLSEVITLFQGEAIPRGIKLMLNADNAPVQSYFSERALRHVAHNLISNAIKFGNGGMVAVRLGEDGGGGLTLDVADKGPGVAPEEQEHIFEDLYQGEAGRAAGGTGIGLALSRKLCEGHGGTLTMTNRRGGGALFRARMPQFGGVPPEVEDPEAHFAPDALHVLVADDVETNLMVIEAMLQQHGVRCTAARNGDEALARLREGGFDAVLMDIAMPGKTGIDVLRDYMAEPGFGSRSVPIASHSAHTASQQLAEYRNEGFGFHLPKPVMLEDIARFLEWVDEAKSTNLRVVS